MSLCFVVFCGTSVSGILYCLLIFKSFLGQFKCKVVFLVKGSFVPKPCRRSSILFDSISNYSFTKSVYFSVSLAILVVMNYLIINLHCPGKRASQIGDLSTSCHS